MLYFLEYLLFCEASGLVFLLCLLFGLIMIIVVIYPGRKRVKGVFFAITIALTGGIGVISIKISSTLEINGDQYATLVKEANLNPYSKSYVRKHIGSGKYISRLDYCILIRHMKNLKATEIKKKLNTW